MGISTRKDFQAVPRSREPVGTENTEVGWSAEGRKARQRGRERQAAASSGRAACQADGTVPSHPRAWEAGQKGV